jgi:predicted DNA-binding transcriptional regulator YafY
MPKIPEDTKRSRLDRVTLLIQRHPDGLSEREIAEDLRFERRTVHNYLLELDLEGKIYRDGHYWYPLPHHIVHLRNPDLKAEEAMILYLAARLFVKQSDRRNETAELVLYKLASILSEDIHLGDDLRDAAQELAQRPKAPDYEDHFRTIMRGYIYRRQVQIVYHPYRGEPFETTFAPYLVEPSAIGMATYAIGYSSLPNALRTYKIERVLRANLLRQEYVIPSDFRGLELLRNAWSIYYGEEVTRVVLRFQPEVSRRVRETYWHPSQVVMADEEHPDCVLLAFEVADTTDLKPWIRAWGANCEVVEPPDLRDEMMGEARRLAHLYGWRTARSEGVDHSRFQDIFGDS